MPTESIKPDGWDQRGARPQGPPEMIGLDSLAWLMDRAIQIPGTNIRFGLDAVLGLLPIGGDALTGMIQTGIVMVAMSQYKVPKAVAARMAANVLLDIGVGSIPFAGDLFDVAFKANTRNIALLREVQATRAAGKEVSSAGSIFYLFGIGALLFGTLALVLIGGVAVIAWLTNRKLF